MLDNGTHIIIDIYDIKNNEELKMVSSIQQMMDKIVDRYNLSVMERTFHQFEPYGVTGVYVLAESHLSVHTFVNERKVAMDLYTCKSMENTDDVVDYIKTLFGGDEGCCVHSNVIRRFSS